MKTLGSRVDGLTLAYRVTLDPAFVEALRERGRIAAKHGRAGFEWRNRVPEGVGVASRDVVRLGGLRARWADEVGGPVTYRREVFGELRYSRAQKVWNLTNQPFFRMHIDAQAPGAEDRVNDVTGERTREGGWTIEIVFYAQWLAEIGLDAALREGEALASLCGDVHETRLRRVDLCADIEGWAIEESDVKCLVKRPRARWQKEYGDVAIGDDGVMRHLDKARPSKKEKHEAFGAQDFGRGALDKRQITGLSVGRGGAMMSRIYDKRVELERDEERRANEEKRWRAKGWDGEQPVTRIEFQIRGTVIREFGLRDPEEALDVDLAPDDRGRMRVVGHRPMVDEDTGEVLGLVDRLDWLWRSCLDWARLVILEHRVDGTVKPASRLKDDPRWAFLRTVQFADARAPHPIKRFRVRSAASAAQGLGVALAQAGRDGELTELPENSGAYDEATAHDELVARVAKLKHDEAIKIVEMLLTKHGGAIGASVHFAVRVNAARLRFKERRSVHADYATGPPHGDGPGASPVAGARGSDSTGDRSARRLVA